MELNYAVVHELQKEAGEPHARENLAAAAACTAHSTTM